MDEEAAITTKIAQLESELVALKAQLAETTSESEAAQLVRRRRDVEDDLSIRRQALAQLRATSEARAKAAAERAEQERRQAVDAERDRRSKALLAKREAALTAAQAAVAAVEELLKEAQAYDGWASSHRKDGAAPCGMSLFNINGLLSETGIVLTPVMADELARRLR
jgi:hypothetical protein